MTISLGQFATAETVTLSPLPCWEHLLPEQIRARVEAIVRRIEETAAKAREESGSMVLGTAAVRAPKPFDQPARPKKSPAPLFHAFTRRVRRVSSPKRTICSWRLFETPRTACDQAFQSRFHSPQCAAEWGR